MDVAAMIPIGMGLAALGMAGAAQERFLLGPSPVQTS